MNTRTEDESDLTLVRSALRTELESRGHHVASDTESRREALYIVGENDLARALFEFQPSAGEAMGTMYQGSWVEGLPPRFAVLPASESRAPELELLEQARIVPVFFESEAGRVTFRDLDVALSEHVGT